MTVLRERVFWARRRQSTERRTSSDLSPEEQTNVRKAIRFLAKRFGTYAKLAEAMGAKRATVFAAASKHGTVSAGVARAAVANVEDVLGGMWPKAGACPHCGALNGASRETGQDSM